MKPHHDTVMIIYCNRKKNQIALSMEFFFGGGNVIIFMTIKLNEEK